MRLGVLTAVLLTILSLLARDGVVEFVVSDVSVDQSAFIVRIKESIKSSRVKRRRVSCSTNDSVTTQRLGF
jgi:hypothetical protein